MFAMRVVNLLEALTTSTWRMVGRRSPIPAAETDRTIVTRSTPAPVATI